jgi:hypothetical protein
MLVLAPAVLLAFVASPAHAPAPTPQLSRACVSPTMGFFDDLKKGFENDERLVAKGKADKTASGKSGNVNGYVQKKVQARQQYEDRVKKDTKKGDEGFDGIFSGWTWK